MTGQAQSAPIGPDEFGQEFFFDLQSHNNLSDRAAQATAGQIGASDLGECRQRVNFILRQVVPSDAPSKWAAVIGSYVDAGVKEARKAARPWLLHDVRCQVTLPNGMTFMCSLDELDPEEPAYTDVKTKAELAAIRRLSAGDQPRWQRHVCYLAAHQNGLVPAEGTVRNIFLDRSGRDDRPHVEQEPFSMDVVLEAQAWLEDADYAAQHGEDASKDWPRSMCESYCEFYTRCRGSEPVSEEYLTGYRATQLAEFVAARQQRKDAEQVEDALRAELLGVTGRSDTHWVRSTVSNGKRPSTRLDAGRISA